MIVFIVYNNELYFLLNDGIFGNEFWKIDGIDVGIIILKDIFVGLLDFYFYNFYLFNNEFYFNVDD